MVYRLQLSCLTIKFLASPGLVSWAQNAAWTPCLCLHLLWCFLHSKWSKFPLCSGLAEKIHFIVFPIHSCRKNSVPPSGFSGIYNLNCSFDTFLLPCIICFSCVCFIFWTRLGNSGKGLSSIFLCVSPKALTKRLISVNLKHLTLIVFPKHFLSHYLIWSLHQRCEMDELEIC